MSEITETINQLTTATHHQPPRREWVPAWGLADVEQSEEAETLAAAETFSAWRKTCRGSDQKARQWSRAITSRSGWRLTLREDGDEIVVCNGRGDVVFIFGGDEAKDLAEAIASFPSP